MKLTKKDYKNILKFYKIKIPKTNKILKKKAEDILSKKLCKCIKKIQKINKTKKEQRIIAICTKSIFTKKGLKRGNFTCKNRQFANFSIKK